VAEDSDAIPAPDVVVRGTAAGFVQQITSGRFHFQADEPEDLGGSDTAPTPYDYLLAALGGCTSMTVGLYARKRRWPLEQITVSLWHSRIHARDCADCETAEGMLDQINVQVQLTGTLDADQHAKLLEIAHKCPVHRSLTGEIKVRFVPPAPQQQP
jgi:putative redox protein